MMLDWTPIELKARDGTALDAEAATLTVPLNHGEAGATLALRTVRLKALAPTGAPPVVFLSGGPGDSGIQWASHGPFLRAFQRVARGVDLILLDQRGSGASEPDLSVPSPTIEPEDLADRAGLRRLLERHVGARAMALSADVRRGMTVVQSAHDLAALADALEEPTVGIWGYSYGTHLSQMTTKLHGDRISRVVLCGFEGPDQTFKLPSYLDRQIERLDLTERLRQCLLRLDDQPAEVGGVRFGGDALRQLVAGWSGISNRFTRLPSLLGDLAHGGTAELERNLKDFLRLWAKPLTFYLTDGASGATPARWAAIRAEEPASLLGDMTNFPFPDAASLVGAADMGDELRQPLESSLAFLVFTGSLDGFTPTANAVQGLESLPNGRHVVIEHAAHNDLIANWEGVDAIGDFFANGVWPEFERLSIPSRLQG